MKREGGGTYSGHMVIRVDPRMLELWTVAADSIGVSRSELMRRGATDAALATLERRTPRRRSDRDELHV